MDCEYILVLNFELQEERFKFHEADPKEAMEVASERVRRKQEELRKRSNCDAALVPVVSGRLYRGTAEFNGTEYLANLVLGSKVFHDWMEERTKDLSRETELERAAEDSKQNAGR